jgi:aspartate aminotransferase
VLPIVRKLEQVLASDESLNKEYLPVLGLPSFTQAATSMLLGKESPAILEGRAVGVQTLSGTGALRVSAEFFSKILNFDTVYSSEPTWGEQIRTNFQKIYLFRKFLKP